MAIAELRANLGYTVARCFGERLISPVELEVHPDATWEDAPAKPNFLERASDYYSLSLAAQDPQEKVRALVELSQELINLGRFRQARQFLKDAQEPLAWDNFLPEAERYYYVAAVQGKLGWIADYEGGYSDSIWHFIVAKDTLTRIQHWDRREEDLNSTAIHFLGRGHFGLAAQGIYQDNHLPRAIHHFQEDLRRYLDLRKNGEPHPAQEGFQHAWLTRCYLLAGLDDSAEGELTRAGGLFSEYADQNPGSGILAHYFLLRGALHLRRGGIATAREDFQEALRIRQEVEHYPKGLADANLGLAYTYLREWNLPAAAKHYYQACKAFPFGALRTVLGA